MEKICDFKYNANHFSLKLEEAAFALSKIHANTPKNIPLYPLMPDKNKEIMFKHMICKNFVDSNMFDADLCAEIYKTFYGNDVCLKYLTDIKKQINSLLLKINALTGESVLVKAALLNYGIAKAEIFPTKNREMADVLSVIYIYKNDLLPTPYFYLDCKEQFDKVYDAGEILDIYVFVFLTLVSQQAGKHVEYLEKVTELRKEISAVVYSNINRPQSDKIVDLIFETPILTADDISANLGITRGQAVRHLHVLEETGVLVGDEKQRNRTFYFARLLGLMP